MTAVEMLVARWGGSALSLTGYGLLLLALIVGFVRVIVRVDR